MGKNYWTKTEDTLIHVYFFTGSTKLERCRALNTLMPKLTKMARIIIERYYGRYDTQKQKDLVTDAIFHFLVYSKYDETKGSYFSYISNIFKHFFLDVLVITPNKTNRINVDDNYDISENQLLVDTVTIDTVNSVEKSLERKEILKKIIDYIDNLILIEDNNIKLNCNKKSCKYKYKTAIFRQQYLIIAKQYFNDYFLEYETSVNSLNDYLITRLGRRNTVVGLTYKIFNITSDTKSYYPYKGIHEANRINKGLSYLMDDYPPELKHIEKNAKQRKINNAEAADKIKNYYF